MPLSAAEDQLLRHLYREFRIPTDQYQRRPADLDRFVTTWNGLAERSDSAGEVLHYMVTKRKNSQWVTFDGDHESQPPMPHNFTASELVCLEAIYQEIVVPLDLGSDNIAFDEQLAARVSAEFFRRTRQVVGGRVLLAAIMVRRKRGDWVTLPPGGAGTGFSDIDEVG
jgi:hypothetical protein